MVPRRSNRIKPRGSSDFSYSEEPRLVEIDQTSCIWRSNYDQTAPRGMAPLATGGAPGDGTCCACGAAGKAVKRSGSKPCADLPHPPGHVCPNGPEPHNACYCTANQCVNASRTPLLLRSQMEFLWSFHMR